MNLPFLNGDTTYTNTSKQGISKQNPYTEDKIILTEKQEIIKSSDPKGVNFIANTSPIVKGPPLEIDAGISLNMPICGALILAAGILLFTKK